MNSVSYLHTMHIYKILSWPPVTNALTFLLLFTFLGFIIVTEI